MHLKLITFSIITMIAAGQLHAAEPMTADAVKSLMTNSTMNGKKPKKNKEFTSYFREDGTSTKLTSKGKILQGKWHVKNNGKHCVDWDKGKGKQCGFIVDLGDGVYSKKDGDKPRIEFTVTQGNSKDL